MTARQSARRPRATLLHASLLLCLLSSSAVHAEDGLDDGRKQDDATTLPTVTATTIKYVPISAAGSSSSVANFGRFPGSRELRGGKNNKEQESDKDPSQKCKEKKGNPIIPGTGNKIEIETDFLSAGEMPLGFTRIYNKHWYGSGLMGRQWLTNFDYKLSFGSSYEAQGICYARPGIPECTNTEGATVIWGHRPDGHQVKFTKAADGVYYEEKAAPVARIVRQADGTWILYSDTFQIERYSTGGYPMTITNRSGVGWTFAYGGQSGTQPQRVTHSSGRFVQFVWVGDELREVRDPAGNSYAYTYTMQIGGGNQLLKTTTLPGQPATTITYHYGSESGEALYGFTPLTGKSFNGVRYSTFAYNAAQQATSTEHAGGVEKFSFGYTFRTDGTLAVTETNPLGKITDYVFRDEDAVSVTGLPSSQCGGSYKETTYDANGNEDLVADFEGNFANYDYDASGRLQTLVEAFQSPEARTTTYVWDTSNNLPTRITVAGLSQTDYAYTDGNRLASVKVTNLSGKGVQGQSLSTSYAYTKHPSGLLATASIDGPLPNDTVTYTYNTQGDLLSVANSLGQATVYSGYNALGQPGRIVGANGDVAEFTYDARGRVATESRVIDGVPATTTFTYDSSGRLQKAEYPGGVATVREYDAAWRVSREYTSEPGGTYNVKRYTYNNASQVTSVVTERTTAVIPPSSVPVITVPARGDNGNYVISWTSVAGTEDYVLDESPNGLSWTAVYSGLPQSKSFSAKPAGTYYYRVRGCNAAGCASPSLHYPVEVIYAPTAAPSISAPAQSTSGSFTVSWASVANASTYQLEESANAGAWTLLQNEGSLSRNVTGKNAGTYRYRVRACNVVGCGALSSEASVVEIDPPGAPPNVFAPASNPNGAYTVSWTTVTGSTGYQLDENVSGGAWATIYSGAGSSIGLSRSGGPFGYRARACNAAGCGSTSTPVYVQAPIYDAQFIGQGIPTGVNITPGEAWTVTVQMLNTGNVTWTAGESYRLGSQSPGDNTRWGLNRVNVPGTVGPGQVATFTFSIIGPNEAEGGKAFQWRMVRDGVTWFGQQTPLTWIGLEVPDGGGGDPDPDPCHGRPNCHEN